MKIKTKSWESVTDEIFLKCKKLFNWKIEKQARKYADLMRRGKIKGKSRTLMAIASIYAAIKDSAYKMSMRDVAKEFKVAELSVRRYFNYLVKLVEGNDG